MEEIKIYSSGLIMLASTSL